VSRRAMASKKFTAPETVTVTVCRNGAELSATCKWSDTQLVLQSFLDVYRRAVKQYPELIMDLGHVGGSQTPYVDDWSGGGDKKIGF
jgi:hypothetical protein